MHPTRHVTGPRKCSKAQSIRIWLLLFLAVSNLCFSDRSVAQVVVSVGVQEVYDDNIFLEDDTGVPPPIVVDSELENPDSDIRPPKQSNGDPDDDIISNLTLGVSGTTKFGNSATGSADVKVGALLFATETDESRMTLDSTLKVQTATELLPQPYYLAATSKVQSRANDITSADGTAARQTESHIGSLELGVTNVELAAHTRLNSSYTFSVTNFLGNLAFSNTDEESDSAFGRRFEDRGSDYISNLLAATVDHDLNDRLIAGVFGSLNNLTFTSVESNDQEPKSKDDLDRLESQVGVSLRYQPTKQFGGDARVGTGLTRLKNKPEDLIFSVIDSNGESVQVQREADQDQLSLLFSAGLLYTPTEANSISLRADQSQITDVDGDRVITRSVSLNGSQALGNRLRGFAGGRFLQYNVGDTIDQPTERFELAATIRYSITEAIAVSTGWNYATQSVDGNNDQQRLLLGSEEYVSNRLFVGIDAGLVGVNK